MCDQEYIKHIQISCKDYHSLHQTMQQWTSDLVDEITIEFGENIVIKSDTEFSRVQYNK